jgi:ABC-type nitrate/sulfonate/bicarbonate transport system substrate-binding protein
MMRSIAIAGVLLGAIASASAQTTLRVGDQKGNSQAVMEAAGVLKDVPYKIEWKEFPAASPLLEALSAGAIETGLVGDAPFTFAAAANVPVKAIGAITPGLGFQVASVSAIRDKRPELEDFLRRLTAARAWSQTNVGVYAETWGKLMNIPPAVPLNWLSRAKIRVAPIDDGVVADEQKTIELYFRSGLIKQNLNAADIVDRSFSGAIGKGAGL